jgi:hypothetical protein
MDPLSWRRHVEGRKSMAQVIQVEIKTGTTHTLTWLDAALKLKPGMALVCKGDPRSWSVVHTYLLTVREATGSDVDWKIRGGEALSCVA